MRYLTLVEAIVIAEFVTGIDATTLARASRLDLLDSALHAPQAGFGDDDYRLALPVDEAVEAMLAIAGGEWGEARAEAWLRTRLVAVGSGGDT